MMLLLFAGPSFAAVPTLSEVRTRHFEVVTMEGTAVPLTDLLPPGRPVLVEFWATWCAPCRKSAPRLVELAKRYQAEGLVIVGLTIEDPVDDIGKVRDFAAKEGIPYPIAFAPEELFQYMNQRDQLGVPKILVYDEQGRVVEHLTRYSGSAMRRVERAVRRVIEEP